MSESITSTTAQALICADDVQTILARWAQEKDDAEVKVAKDRAEQVRQNAHDCRRLHALKKRLGLRHLAGIKPGTTRDSMHWLEQEIWPLPAGMQCQFFELAAVRAERTTGKAPEMLGTIDLLTSLWEILEQGHAA